MTPPRARRLFPEIDVDPEQGRLRLVVRDGVDVAIEMDVSLRPLPDRETMADLAWAAGQLDAAGGTIRLRGRGLGRDPASFAIHSRLTEVDGDGWLHLYLPRDGR